MAKDKKEKKEKKEKKDKKEKKENKRNEKKEKKESKRDEKSGVENPITAEDYFLKHEEYLVWLKAKKDVAFESLSSEENRKIFGSEFVKAFNKGKLPSMYYDGIPPEILKSIGGKSTHKWSFKLSARDQEKLDDTAEDILKDTRTAESNAGKIVELWSQDKGKHSGNRDRDRSDRPPRDTNQQEGSKGGFGQGKDSSVYGGQVKDNRTQERAYERGMDKRRSNEYLEEVGGNTGKLTGRDAALDKKKERNFQTHQGANARDELRMGGQEYSDNFLMGGGGEDERGGGGMRQVGQRDQRGQRDGRDHREEKKQKRTEELLQKGQEQNEAWKNKLAGDLGIDLLAGGGGPKKIVIAPRNP